MEPVDQILKDLRFGVVKFDEDLVRTRANALLEAGCDPLDGILKGLSSGMQEVGRLFKEQEYFVPEVLLCADAMNAGLEILRPHLKKTPHAKDKRIILGSMQGDVHDIGKNIVKMMLEVGGFTVQDLGVDVPHEKFLVALQQDKADLVGLSAMMTTTMMGMKTVIGMIKRHDPSVGVIIGGAPVNRQIMKLFRADGYCESASDVIEEATRVMENMNSSANLLAVKGA